MSMKATAAVLSGKNEVYVKEVLPLKMEYNLKAITSFNFIKELGTMISTVVKV